MRTADESRALALAIADTDNTDWIVQARIQMSWALLPHDLTDAAERLFAARYGRRIDHRLPAWERATEVPG